AVGALIGILSWVTFSLMGKALGTSTTFVHVAAFLEGLISPEHVYQNEYYAKSLQTKPLLDWQFALVLLMPFGAWLGARLGGEKRVEHVPSLWKARFGSSRGKRYLGAFIGGALVLFGARLAGGCTSGHAISGGLQFAVSSWVFMVALFGVGIPAAMAIYGRSHKSVQ
ncbi:MAG: YeeE/YedE family protein, partial [Bdellovibrionales bacterium]|nr:YeeE/YedE family protein [Bdellovibrionales bacterium]